MRAIEVAYPGGPLELVERPAPTPGLGQVLIRVQACGVCHSDETIKEGLWPSLRYPLTPGHEVAGVIDALGEGVVGWSVGQRVGVGWFGGHCGHCEPCRRGSLAHCVNQPITGVTRHGGYAEAMVADAAAVALIPDELSAVEAAPMLCAGISVYNGLKRCGAGVGDIAAVQGIGGLGHLAVQFAVRMGLRVAAIDRGSDRKALAMTLGAHWYIDSNLQDVGASLAALGGAKAILATAPDAKAMGASIKGLSLDGVLLVLGIPNEPIPVLAVDLLSGRSIKGSAGGVAIEAEDTLKFSAQTGVRPIIEVLPLERAAEAYDKMMSGKARFRMVLTTGL